MTVICATHEAAGGPDSETETIETWTQKTVELSAEDYAGKTVYIAFRHLSYDCYILKIDDFAVGAEAPAHTHTVTFDANGGSVTPTSAETGTDGKLATLPTPTRSGYSFDGWYTMKEGGTEITAEKVYTADTAIYAHWVGPFSFAHLPKTGLRLLQYLRAIMTPKSPLKMPLFASGVRILKPRANLYWSIVSRMDVIIHGS